MTEQAPQAAASAGRITTFQTEGRSGDGEGLERTPESPVPRWDALKREQPQLRIRDAAYRLGVSEAELVATGCGENAARLAGDWRELVRGLEALGEVMALTRNDHAVIEKDGVYHNVRLDGHVGLVLDERIDLRIFFDHWHFGFAVTERGKGGERHSLQFFDADGVAVHKVYRGEKTDAAAWDALVERFRGPDQGRLQRVRPPLPSTPERPDAEIDVEGFRAGWLGLTDTHQFFGLLKKFGVSRPQALRLAPPDMATPVPAAILRRMLEGAAATDLPIMVFVASRGVIEIHTGPVHKLLATGPWYNVLDPGFNLHLREEAIDTAWIVRKPTSDGVVTSLELFDAKGGLIAQLFGKRKPGVPEDVRWREVLEDARIAAGG